MHQSNLPCCNRKFGEKCPNPTERPGQKYISFNKHNVPKKKLVSSQYLHNSVFKTFTPFFLIFFTKKKTSSSFAHNLKVVNSKSQSWIRSSDLFSQPGISQLDLLSTWTEEARSALEAKKLGSIVDLWKVVAERQVIRKLQSLTTGLKYQICFSVLKHWFKLRAKHSFI